MSHAPDKFPPMKTDVGEALKDMYLHLRDAQEAMERAIKKANDPNLLRYLYTYLDDFEKSVSSYMIIILVADTMIAHKQPFPDMGELGATMGNAEVPPAVRDAFGED